MVDAVLGWYIHAVVCWNVHAVDGVLGWNVHAVLGLGWNVDAVILLAGRNVDVVSRNIDNAGAGLDRCTVHTHANTTVQFNNSLMTSRHSDAQDCRSAQMSKITNNCSA